MPERNDSFSSERAPNRQAGKSAWRRARPAGGPWAGYPKLVATALQPPDPFDDAEGVAAAGRLARLIAAVQKARRAEDAREHRRNLHLVRSDGA